MEMSGALAATPWPVLGEVVLPHLRLADEVRNQVPQWRWCIPPKLGTFAVTHLACIWNMYMAYVLGGDNNGDFFSGNNISAKGKVVV
jgi:hypothetical protein